MFDIGFSELVVCGIVALVVIGPERLPRVARTLGVLFGRLQRYVAQVKSDINREMDMADLGNVKKEFESAARSFETDFKAQAADVEREVRDAQTAIEQSIEPAASAQLDLGIEEPSPPVRPPKGPGEQ
jgi:sec-independent protein translocase protein TatB